MPSLLSFAMGGCVAAARAPALPTPSFSTPTLTTPLDTAVAAALADAARRTGIRITALSVQSAEAVTWRDGSLGCEQPGMAYSQALAPGFRIRIRAADTVFDYHAGRGGPPVFCPPGRAAEPLPADGQT